MKTKYNIKMPQFLMAVFLFLSTFLSTFTFNIESVMASDSLSGTVRVSNFGRGNSIILHNGAVMGNGDYDFITYEKDGKKWPAYCTQPQLAGANKTGYNVEITGVLDNKNVQSAIANSYPFVSLAEMGLKTEHEAYTITKMVIRHFVGGAAHAESTYTPAPSYGYAFDAYKKLLKKAKNEEFPVGNSISAEKESVFIEKDGNQIHPFVVRSDGKDYSGEYTVDVGENAPSGTTIQNKNGNKFSVVIPLSSIPDDFTGTFDLKLVASGGSGSAIVYDSIPTQNASTRQNYALTYSQSITGSGSVKYSKKTPDKGSGALRILKREAGTLKPLSGATFRLIKLDGADAGKIGDFVTDTKGEIIFNDLTPGAYEVREINAPKGHLLDVINVKNVTITAANQTQQDVTFDNFSTPKLKLKKVSSTGEIIVGAVFKISLDGGTESYMGTTDSSGEIVFGSVVDLKPGSYKVEEISVLAPYILDSTPKWVKLEPGKTSEVVFKNLKKIKWRLWKYEKGTGILLDGAQFGIKNIDTNTIVWEGLVKDGFHELDSLDPGWYRIYEIAAPYGYVMEFHDEFGHITTSSNYQDIKLEADKEIDVKFDNIKRPEIEVRKEDEKGNPVAGAIFQFKKADGETLFEKQTDASGKIIIEYDDKELQLSEGIYEIKEVKAPDGYVADKNCVQTVTLANGERKVLTFVNYKKPELTIIKVDEETKEPLKGAKFKIIRTEDETIKEAITDANGKIVLTNLEPGIYSIEELIAPHGYILETQHKDIELNPSDKKELIWTNKSRPRLRIQKVDANTGELLKNSEFKVTKVEDKTVSEYILENGEIILENLDEAIYRAHEFQAPEGYVIVQDTKEIMTEWGKTKTLKFDNIRKPIVLFQKTNALTGKGIAGAKFKVEFEQMNGGIKTIGNFTTDKSGKITIPKGEPGWYIFTEIMPAPGFSLPKNPVTRQYFAAGDNAYLVEFSKYYTAGTGKYASGYAPNDGTTLPPSETGSGSNNGVENGNGQGNSTNIPSVLEVHYGGEYYVEGEGFNWPLNSIVLKKADANTGKLLNGAAIELYRADEQVSGQPGTQIGRYVTDASGVVVVVGLEPGYYVAKEVQAPQNYILAETSLQNGFLKADGTTVLEFTFRNYPFGNILVTKIDGITGEPLANATFKVTNNAGAAVGNSTGEFITDSLGQFLVPNIEPGSYVVTEIKAPDNYAINTTPKTVQVGTDGKTYKISFDNYPYSSILISKVDAITGEPLANATFKVTDADGKAVGNTTGEFTTNSTGEVLIHNVAPGSYVATEIKAPTNYAINTTPKTVEVKADAKVYKISFDNYPYGSLVIKKMDNDTKEPLANAEFKVKLADGNVVGNENGLFRTDAKGTIVIPNLPKGAYVIQETKAPVGYVLENQSKTIEIDYGKSYTLDFFNTKKSSLQIIKIDGQTKQPLKDAKFNVYKMNGELLGQYTTNGEGLIIIDALDDGWYKVSEYKAPEGFILDETPKDVEIVGNQFVKLVFENQPKASLIIKKFDASTKQPLIGAKFKITKKSGDVIGEFTSDANGIIQKDNLEPGWYSAVEVTAPVGYKLVDQAKDFEIKHTQTVTLEFPNEKLTSLIIKKVDDKSGEPLGGAKFWVERQNGEHVGEYSTDKDGFINLPTLAPDFYVIREQKAPNGYLLDESPKTVEVKTNVPTLVTFTNKRLTALEIIKTDEKSGEPLNGAKFVVERQNGERVGEYTTSEKGIISIPTLQPDWYVVKEVKSPDGYVLDEAPKTIEVKTNAPTVVKFTNKKMTSLQIKKIDGITGQALPGAKFTVEKQNGEKIYTNENGTDFTTDAQGFINIPTLSPDYYIVREVKAPPNYIIDETPKTVEVKTDSPTVVTFSNMPLASLQIKKINSETRQPIEGVEFIITKMSGEKVGSYKTGKDGLIFVSNLENGYYTVTEVKAADGYFIDSEPKTVEIKSGKPTVLEVENKPASGLLIVKTDAKTGKPLQGVVFDVRKADGQRVASSIIDQNQPNTQNNSPNKSTTPNGDISGSYTTDANDRILINTLSPGEYHVIETKALSGYILDTEVHSVTITPGKQASLQLKNVPMSGLRILKIDSVTKKGIRDVEFRVYDFETNKEVGGPYITDNNGVIDFAGVLPAGRYKIVETREANGYLRDNLPRTIDFRSGQILEIVWENQPQMGQVQVTKKSSSDNEVNGLPKGTPLAGAVFEIYHYKTGNLLDQFTTGNNGVGVSKPLPIGRYVMKEVVAPKYYKLSDEQIDFEIEFSSQIVKFNFVNDPANTGVSIKKVGPSETMAGQQIRYDFKVIQNTSTVPLTDFYWRDVVPGNVLQVDKLITGTYNQGLKYKIMYKTNKNDYRVMADNLSTTHNNVVDASPVAIGLFSGEYITEIMYVFGNVKAGFSSVEAPMLYATVKSGFPNGHQFVNKADIGGKYGNEWIISNTTWVTTIFGKQPPKLPRTGY